MELHKVNSDMSASEVISGAVRPINMTRNFSYATIFAPCLPMTAGDHPAPSAAFVNNCSDAILDYAGTSGPVGDNNAHDYYTQKVLADVLGIVITPMLCIFGCIGNILNLVVLSRIRFRMRKVDGGKESVTHTGLILLAISDMLFCLSMTPRGFGRLASTMSFFSTRGFALYYQAYGSGLVTTFILTSTWVTVAMAVLRYVGICHPLTTRKVDSRVYGRVVYAAVIVISVLVNLPAFWQFKIDELPLGPGQMAYLIDIGTFDKESLHGRVFLWVRAFYAVFIPAALLSFCNFSLIRTLRQSYRMRRAMRVQDSASRNSSRITLLLVVLVVMFIVLVFPSEIMDFCTDNIKLSAARTETFLAVRAFANVLQVLNFAVNFVLYCSMNVQFRSTMRDLFLCRACCSERYHRKYGSACGSDRKHFSTLNQTCSSTLGGDCSTTMVQPSPRINLRLSSQMTGGAGERGRLMTRSYNNGNSELSGSEPKLSAV